VGNINSGNKEKGQKADRKGLTAMVPAITLAEGQGAGETGRARSARACVWDFGSVFRDQTPKDTQSVPTGLEPVPRTNSGQSAGSL